MSDTVCTYPGNVRYQVLIKRDMRIVLTALHFKHKLSHIGRFYYWKHGGHRYGIFSDICVCC